jgi:hypothetical protein
VFVIFLVTVYSAILIAVLGVMVSMFASKFENIKVTLLLIYTVLPMTAYVLFFFNNSLLRSYTPYMLAGYVILTYFIDKIDNKVWKNLILVVCILNVMFTYYPFPNGIIEFWNEPMIRNEVYIKDYQGWIDEAKDAEKNGYTIVPMMTLIGEEYYFGIDIDMNQSLTMLDEQNERIMTDEEIVSEFEKMMMSDGKYVVMVDTLGRDALIRVGLYDILKDEYRHTLYYDKWYDDGMSIFYIE